jgi:two-component system, OmpR family, sensor kinase
MGIHAGLITSGTRLIEDLRARESRLFATLRRLLALNTFDLMHALDEACVLVREALGADEVEVFIYDAPSASLIVMGALHSPTRLRQCASDLDRLLLTGGGLTVKVFRDGGCYRTGQATQDPDERLDIVEMLGFHSALLCCLQVDDDRYGVLQALSAQPVCFSADDESFLDAAARWMGLVTHRGELVKQVASDAVEDRRLRVAAAVHHLTARECEVAVLVARGLTNEQIAERIVVVVGTVSNHVYHILRKLGFNRRAQIATWIVQHGLWTPDAD